MSLLDNLQGFLFKSDKLLAKPYDYLSKFVNENIWSVCSVNTLVLLDETSISI